jgi:hypothetical protein
MTSRQYLGMERGMHQPGNARSLIGGKITSPQRRLIEPRARSQQKQQPPPRW